jgi:hypothetical protein
MIPDGFLNGAPGGLNCKNQQEKGNPTIAGAAADARYTSDGT